MADDISRRALIGVIAATPLAVATNVLADVPPAAPVESQVARERVLGFGGFFFRAKDPAALAQWYRKHLGIDPAPQAEGEVPWHTLEGPTVFAPFPENTDYFGDPEKQFMLNFRVRDMDAMIAQLVADGINVVPDPTPYPYGRFARIHDPEGNPIELWQPM
ncbi:MAG TPA: VOC family protein [Micropepsaceae bacterium]|nr:VOC family protein [Micropepsaceae bacterium]